MCSLKAMCLCFSSTLQDFRCFFLYLLLFQVFNILVYVSVQVVYICIHAETVTAQQLSVAIQKL